MPPLALLVSCLVAADPLPPFGPLPDGMTRISSFGERADWSPDGKRVIFLSKTFGDVFEMELETRELRLLTQRHFHEGYVRAMHLKNGDVLLSGAPEFDARDPWRSRSATPELWVLRRPFRTPPVRLGVRCSEGPAVSRSRMRIAWTWTHSTNPDLLPEGVSQMWIGDLQEIGESAVLTNRRLILDSRSLPFKCTLETQDFRSPEEKELTFSAYGHQGTDVCGVEIETGKVTNYSIAPEQYDEPEGIFPDGKSTLVECDRHNKKGSGHVDLYRLQLDGSGRTERLTFLNDRGYKASNPQVSPDGKRIAFQEARPGEPAGVGHGILVLELR